MNKSVCKKCHRYKESDDKEYPKGWICKSPIGIRWAIDEKSKELISCCMKLEHMLASQNIDEETESPRFHSSFSALWENQTR